MSLAKSELQIEAESEANLQTASQSLAKLYKSLEATLNEEEDDEQVETQE